MDRREQVRRWLARRDRHGLTFRELSDETGVPIGTLASWAWKLRQKGPGQEAHGRPSHGFVELVGDPDRGGSRGGIEIVLAGGRRVVVPDEVDEDRLVRVVRALERC
jgi:hypothetical protein